MSLLYCDEAWDEETRIDQTNREYIRYFKAQCSAVADGAKEILLGRPDLAPFQPHPKDNAALVSEFFPKRIPGSTLFDIQVTYSTEVNVTDNPLAEPAKITIDTAEHSRIQFVDADGKPKINTAGDLIDDPPPEVEDCDIVFNVQKNLPIRLPAWILLYPNAVNNDTIRVRGLTLEPEKVKFKHLAIGEEQFQNKVDFCAVAFQLHYRRVGWTTVVPNRGFNQLVKKEVSGKKGKQFVRQKITVKDDGGAMAYPTEPQFLDKDGKALDPDTITAEKIVLLEFDDNLRLPFSALPLK